MFWYESGFFERTFPRKKKDVCTSSGLKSGLLKFFPLSVHSEFVLLFIELFFSLRSVCAKKARKNRRSGSDI